MNKWLLAVSAFAIPLLTVGAAHAQAPGEQLEPVAAPAPVIVAAPAPVAVVAAPAPVAVVAAPAPVAVVAAPVVVAPVAAPVVMAPALVPVIAAAAPAACATGVIPVTREPLMANRWSAALSIGGMGLTPNGSKDTTSFTVGELALRYRATPHLELELSGGGGREQLDSGMQGSLEVTTVLAALRYRINPFGDWNAWVTGGIGGAAVTFHDATNQQVNNATHPMEMLGFGVERRFNHLGLQAEMRVLNISKKDSNDNEAPAVQMANGTVATDAANTTQTGAELTVGASWYF